MNVENLAKSAILSTSAEQSNMKIREVINNTIIVVNGGLNGCGKWSDYDKDIKNFMKELNIVANAKIIDRFEDHMDDVFSITIKVD
jgi:hypothetical protein